MQLMKQFVLKKMVSSALIIIFSGSVMIRDQLREVQAVLSSPVHVMALMKWSRTGFNEQGQQLSGSRDFPWQQTDRSVWGRESYPMMDPNTGELVLPLFYTRLYLSPSPSGDQAVGKDPLYVVLDDHGNLWFDPDGIFHYPEADPYRDPYNPSFLPGSCADSNMLDGRIRYSIDPANNNNTRGPYSGIFIRNGFETVLEIGHRKFLIGLFDQTDYKELSMVEDNDQDMHMSLINFLPIEKHADQIESNGKYDPFEWIYRVQSEDQDQVEPGDIRLTPVYHTRWKKLYEPNTIVKDDDYDVGTPLASFNQNEKHTEQVNQDGYYSVGPAYGYPHFYEHIYRSEHVSVRPGDLRLSPVNVNLNEHTYELKHMGLTEKDGILLHEIIPSGTSATVAVQTNYVKLSGFKISAGLYSFYGDVPNMTCSLHGGTWIDDDAFIAVNFFHPVEPKYAGSIGCKWWLDDGRNNLISPYPFDPPVAHNVSDDYIEMKRSEEIFGMMNRSPDPDYQIPLLPLPESIKFIDHPADGEWGAGLPFYRDNDHSNQVSEGDERLTDIIVIRSNNEIKYSAGSRVAAGDADIGRAMETPSSLYRFADRHPFNIDKSNNQHYDVFEPIYRKKDSFSDVSIVEGGDVRITKAEFGGRTYAHGSLVVPMMYVYYQSQFFGLNNNHNGDFRYADVMIKCGAEAWVIEADPGYKVEQTMTISVHFPDLAKGERMIVIVDEPSEINNPVPRPLVVEEWIGPKNGFHQWTLTLYRSSITNDGWKAPLSIIGFRDSGGGQIPYREFRDRTKQSWFFENIWDERAMKYIDRLPKDFYPDRVTINEAWVHPEELDIYPSKDTLSIFDSRLPHFWAYAKNKPNPLDINDPSPIISSYEGQPLLANINAQGAGISYIAVAFAYMEHDPSQKQRFIVQVNEDQTYWFWFWEDVEPKGVFNFGDRLSSQPVKMEYPPIHRNNDCVEPWYYSEEDPLGFNILTKRDHLGIFDGQEHTFYYNDQAFTLSQGYVETYGIPVLTESYGKLNISDPGGDFPIPLHPLFENDELLLRVYFSNVLLDYNNTMHHPPWYIQDHTNRINYLGYHKIKTSSIDDINFTNLSVVDHALQYSDVNYTAGENPLSPMREPIIASPYNPIIRDFERDFSVYPGGQAHVVRTAFRHGVGQRRFRRGPSLPYNAYPSITSYHDPLSYIRKLGVEHEPFTDYSFYFTLQSKYGEYLRFDMDAPDHLRVQRIEIEGPVKIPAIIHEETGSVVPESGYPISYHFDGPYVIGREISQWYQSPGKNWNHRIGFGRNEIIIEPQDANPLLQRTGLLDYRGLSYVFALQEITPIQGGTLYIRIYTALGQMTKLEIPVHGLNVENVPDSLELNVDHTLRPVLVERMPFQTEEYCNNALVYMWQDRGIRLYADMLMDPIEMGAGDSRLNRNVGQWMDLNLDGKISFGDFETEIIGTYDLATNTWMGGVYDARTFNVNMGIYPLELTEANNARLTQFGADFGSRSGRIFRSASDHIISADEECPVYITAYKYYDDNNDRAFTPLYRGNSHEVYLAAEHRIRLMPQETLIVDVSPSPLTAGCTPELVDRNTPLTFTVRDASGRPLDFRFGVMDPRGRSEAHPDDIHQHLFDDTPVEPLPQYYWLRTDLHNDDLGYASNTRMYSKDGQHFSPIRVDFSRSYDGIYSFYNFTANDEGSFEVKVYTPDRLHMGRVMVQVVPPRVEYTISPLMTQGRVFQGIGSIRDTDFILTAGANKYYVVTMRAFNAQGQLIRGIERENPFRNPDERDMIFHSGRLTPYTSLPSSHQLHLKYDHIPSPYFLHMTLYQPGQNIEITRSNTFPMGFMDNHIYNTTNIRYDNGRYAISGTIEQNNSKLINQGWGYGCIYNHPHHQIYCFADLDGDGLLTTEDSLKIGSEGTASIILHADDVCRFGVLVGANFFSDHPLFSDVAGKAPVYSDDPATIRGRFRRPWRPIHGYTQADGIFALDWDAFPDHDLQLSPPRMTILKAKTGMPYRRDLMHPANYDLIYGIENHIQVIVHPADPRDFPINQGMVRLFGNTHEAFVHGALERSDNQSSTRITFTPTGVGESVAHLLFTSQNALHDRSDPLLSGPSQFAVDPNISFDSVRALSIRFPKTDFMQPDIEQTLQIRILEQGTHSPIQNVTVALSSTHRSLKSITDKDGESYFTFTPIDNEQIRVYAFKENYLEAEQWIKINR